MPAENNPAEPLKRALADARLRDVDVATRLQVAPKTVDRWLRGRMPQTRHRWALADLVGRHEFDLWPQLRTTARSAELRAVYSYRSSVPTETWRQFFESAQSEIGILVYSGLFVAEDITLLRIMEGKAREGVTVRILLGDPDSDVVAARGEEEGIADAMAAKVRNAIVHYRVLAECPGIEIRLHRTVLYNSVYRSDDDVLVNPHVLGITASHAPVFHLHREDQGDMFHTYAASFERVWADATPLNATAHSLASQPST